MHGTFKSDDGTALRREAVVAALLLAALIALGGGGSPAPLAELACQLIAAIAVLAGLVLAREPAPSPRGMKAVIGLAVIVPVLQLIPLPPALWQALPGRADAIAVLQLVGAADAWRPLSLVPHRTLAALLALGPPLAVLWFAARSGRRELVLLVGVVAAMTLAAVLVGAGQLAQGKGGWLDFYATGEVGVLHGFQANRNTAADVLLVGVVALALVWSEWRGPSSRTLTLAAVGLGGVLLLGTFLTGSRTGIALIPVTLYFVVLIVRAKSGRPAQSVWLGWRLWAGAALALLAAVGAMWWWRASPVIGRVLARFEFGAEFRPELWRDAWYAAAGYWPVGSGLGTFVPAMLPAERLEVVDATIPNRAHNEFLELLLEGGLPLLAIWAVIAAMVGLRLRRALVGQSLLPRSHALFATAVLTIAGLHSLVDYPLRSMAMASLVALAAGIVFAAVRDNSGSSGRMAKARS